MCNFTLNSEAAHARIQKILSEEAQLWQRFILVDEGREDPNTTESGLLSLKLRFTGGPKMAQHWIIAW